jgi:DNA-binding GntR family transcriptional regulator
MPSTVLTPVTSPVPLEKIAYDAIKEAILDFSLKPGETLVETEVARQLSISKTPVRDALSRLEKEGFIVKVAYKGYYIADISRKSMADIFQIRAVLEGLAVRLSTPKLEEADIQEGMRLIEEHSQAAMAGNIALASKLNREFHDLILNKAGNERLQQIIGNLEDHLRRYRTLSNYQSGRLQKSVDEHRQIIKAIVEHDAESAEKATRNHIESVINDLAIQDFDELLEKIVSQEK